MHTDEKIPFYNWWRPLIHTGGADWLAGVEALVTCRDDFAREPDDTTAWIREMVARHGHLRVAVCAAAKIQLTGNGCVDPAVEAWADRHRFVMPEYRVYLSAPAGMQQVEQVAAELIQIEKTMRKAQSKHPAR